MEGMVLQQVLITHLKTLTVKARRALIVCRRESQRYKDKEITKELVVQVNVHIIVLLKFKLRNELSKLE